MSVTVCRAALMPKSAIEKKKFDFWNSIQTNDPYIHPLIQRSSILMTQKSLEICTEALGSENGSNDFISFDEFDFSFKAELENEETEEEEELGIIERKKSNFSIGRRSFPPPLPSISRRNGSCFKLKSQRCDGRLVVDAVPVPSVNSLHAERLGGRLVLSFVDSSVKQNRVVETQRGVVIEEEEEVEVLDRGSIIEVKVSKQAAVKPRRSSLVINKFVFGPRAAERVLPEIAKLRGTTAAAAAMAVSMLTSTTEGFGFERENGRWGTKSMSSAAAAEAKLLFASRSRNRKELLRDMRRCSELRRPLFIFEQPHCIAT